MSKEDKFGKAFPEIQVKKDEKQEVLEAVPAEVLAKALRGMLQKNKEGETVEYKWVDQRGLIEYVESDQAMKAHNDRFKDVIEGIKVKLGTGEA